MVFIAIARIFQLPYHFAAIGLSILLKHLSTRHSSNYLMARNRHAHGNYGASAFGPCDTDFSSHEMGAFSHSDDAQSLCP